MVSPCSIHMSPLWGFKTFVCRACYKHAAPLGLNTPIRPQSWGRGFLAQRVGEPNPYGYSFGCSRSNFRVSRIPVHMSPLWGFKTFVCRACYKHAAPLGLNAAELAARYRSWGRGFLAQRVGRPNPYGYSFGCSRSNFRVSRIPVHMSPLWGFSSPSGLGTFVPPVFRFTCRPSGACGIL